MLTQKQVKEIREHMDRAQNPLFFFHNDPDGLCSFLLCQRFMGRGKGVQVKSFPYLDSSYFHKVLELNPDYIFVVDYPVISDDFFEEVAKLNIPIVWIDHHDVEVKVPANVYYYNPLLNRSKTNEPVTALCYQITGREKDLWLAVTGCISDKYVPEFYGEFVKKYPELAPIKKQKIIVGTSDLAFDIFYRSQIGKIARLMNFGLKDSTSNVVRMMKYLRDVETPHEVLEEDKKNMMMHKKYNEIMSHYHKLLEKALVEEKENPKSKLLFFKYGGESSMSSNLANELSYLFPKKYVVVAYVFGERVNLSARGKGIKDIMSKAMEGLEEATGGGHEDAVGGRIRVNDLESFRGELERGI